MQAVFFSFFLFFSGDRRYICWTRCRKHLVKVLSRD